MVRPFEVAKTNLPDAMLITPFQATDERGGTVKAYSREVLLEHGIDFVPVELLHITSKAGVLRGLHFQTVKPQPKLVSCVYGHIWCVLVDVRKDGQTFGTWISQELTEESGTEIYVPAGCAFGTLALEDSMISCQCGEKFYAEYECGIRWDDPELKIQWPLDKIQRLILSGKDINWKSFRKSVKVS